jgi:hypothetical protein
MNYPHDQSKNPLCSIMKYEKLYSLQWHCEVFLIHPLMYTFIQQIGIDYLCSKHEGCKINRVNVCVQQVYCPVNENISLINGTNSKELFWLFQ